MNLLYQQIDNVRNSRAELPDELRSIVQEIPGIQNRRTISRLAASLEQHTSAAQLVANFPDHCWLLTMRSASATTDAMTAMLELSAYQQQSRSKKIRAIAYPMILAIVACTMMLFGIMWLIPPFDEMYSEFGVNLPHSTVLLIKVSRWVNGHILLSLTIVAVTASLLFGLLWTWISDANWKQFLFGPRLTGPALKQSLANAALQIAELIDDGVELESALYITAQSCPQRILGVLLGELAAQAKRDPMLLHSAHAATAFPANFILALNPSTATRSGARQPNTAMLRELAASYRDLSILGNTWFSLVFGQAMVVAIGLMVAITVLSLFAPLVSVVYSLS